MAFIRPLGLAGLLCAPLACADEPCEDNLQVCDIGSADCQLHVFEQTACARGHQSDAVPSVDTITRSEFEEFLRSGEEPTAEQQRTDAQIATALRMLALLPQGTTSNEEAAIAAYAANVLAFYSRTDASVTIISTNLGDVDDDTAVFILSHEFVHAQQDVDIGLQPLFDEHATSGDASTAVRCLTEGEAVHYSNVTMARQRGAAITAEIFDEYYAELQESSRALAAGEGSDGSYTEVSSIFPYYFGGELVTDRWFRDGNGGVLSMYDDPPDSTAAVLRTLADDAAVALDNPTISAEPMPAGWSIVADDVLGAWVLYAYARRLGLSDEEADGLARTWVGDRILVAGGATEGEVAVIWTIRFADDAGPALLAGRTGNPPEGVMSVAQNNRDVSLVLAVDDPTLMLWESTFETAATVESTDRSFRRGRLAPGLPRPKLGY